MNITISFLSFVLSWFCLPPSSFRALWSMFVCHSCCHGFVCHCLLPSLLHLLPMIRRSSHEYCFCFSDKFRCGRSMFLTVNSLPFVLSRFCLPLFLCCCVQFLLAPCSSEKRLFSFFEHRLSNLFWFRQHYFIKVTSGQCYRSHFGSHVDF